MRTKKTVIYALLAVLSLALSYLETFIPLDFLVPGVKLGLGNTVALLLAYSGKIKGAFAVNITRILLCGLLFGTPVSLLFSLTGGIMSLIVTALISKCKKISVFGAGITGGTVHNTGQLLAAAVVFKTFNVAYYLPFLMLCGALCGAFTGLVCVLLLKNKHINKLLSF